MAKFTANEMKNWDTSTPDKMGRYVPARPLNYQLDGFVNRLKLAWKVFTGKCDVLDWQEDRYASPATYDKNVYKSGRKAS